METIRTIKLHAQEIKKEKQTFIACSTEINGKWFKVKFTKDCETTPKIKGLYDLTIDFDECSVEKGKKFTTSKGKSGVSNDIIWVRHIVNLRRYSDDELKAENRNDLSKIFGEV